MVVEVVAAVEYHLHCRNRLEGSITIDIGMHFNVQNVVAPTIFFQFSGFY